MSIFSVTALDRLIESLDDRAAVTSRGGNSRLASAVEQCCSAASSFKSVASSYASSFKGSHSGNVPSVRTSPLVELGNDTAGFCRVSLLPPTSPLHIPGSRTENEERAGSPDQVGISLFPGDTGLERAAEELVGGSAGRPSVKRQLSWERSRTLRRLLAVQSTEAETGGPCVAEQSSNNLLEGCTHRDFAVPQSGSSSQYADLEFAAARPCLSPVSSNPASEEFADAADAFLDGSSSDEEGSVASRSTSRRELFPGLVPYKELALQLQREIEKRRQVEGVVSVLQEELERRQLCSVVPSSVPGPHPGVSVEPSGQLKLEDEWNQRLAVARMLSAAITRGAAKAEAQEELDAVVGEKNRELSRYRDKILYYETILHEMSQINQQSIESARQQRRRRQRLMLRILSSVGAAVCLGLSTAAAHRYGLWEHIKNLKWEPQSLGETFEDVGDSGGSLGALLNDTPGELL